MASRCVCVEDYRLLAQEKLGRQIFAYIDSGADEERTRNDNSKAFSKLVMIPRVLRSAQHTVFERELFGKSCAYPFGFAPWAMNKIVHSDGELIPAKVASDNKLPYILSTLTNTSPRQIREVNGSGLKMLQLYWSNNEERNLKLIRIAEESGFDALVMTVDAQVLGIRRREERDKLDSSKYHFPLLEELLSGHDGPKQRVAYLQNRDLSLNWDTIAKIRKQTHLKIVLKGIMHPSDAAIAVDYCDAIYVSNHGGRQLDTTPATIQILPRIVCAVGKKVPILIDGGFLTGGDIFKGLALGADFIFLGRAVAYSMTDGYGGVEKMVNMMKDQLRRTMILNGVTSVKQINGDYIGFRSKL